MRPMTPVSDESLSLREFIRVTDDNRISKYKGYKFVINRLFSNKKIFGLYMQENQLLYFKMTNKIIISLID